MSEAPSLVLEPAEVSLPGRVELPLTSGGLSVAEQGLDLGTQEVTPYEAEGSVGKSVIDHRLENRLIHVPLIIRATEETSFDDWRERLQAAVSVINNGGGGWLRRTFASGRKVYVDIETAKAHFSSNRDTEVGDFDHEAILELNALPDFYGAEVTESLGTGTGDLARTLIVGGDLPARVTNFQVTDTSGNAQLGLMWHARGRNYSSSERAKWAYNAESLLRLDAAEEATLSGSYGTKVVKHPSLSTSWTPVLSTNLKSGEYLTHTGLYNVWARVYTTSTETPWLRLLYGVGDVLNPSENVQVRVPGSDNYYLVNLGQVNVAAIPFGEQRWEGLIQARGEDGGENLSIDRLWLECGDESCGVLSVPLASVSTSAAFAARDEFNQEGTGETANLEGLSLELGGSWSEVSKTGSSGFKVNGTSKRAERTANGDASLHAGCYALAGTTEHTAFQVQADIELQLSPTFLNENNEWRDGVFGRYSSTENWIMATLSKDSSAHGTLLSVVKREAGTETVLGSKTTGLSVGAKQRVVLLVTGAGSWSAYAYSASAAQPGAPLLTGTDPALATGGSLAKGKIGIYDALVPVETGDRNFDNFLAFAPEQDAVIFGDKSARLTSKGMFRESEDGKGYGWIAYPGSDLPRLPVSGPEERPVEIALKPSRGNFAELPDTGKDGLSATLTYRPTWSNIPNGEEGEAWSSSVG